MDRNIQKIVVHCPERHILFNPHSASSSIHSISVKRYNIIMHLYNENTYLKRSLNLLIVLTYFFYNSYK